MYTKYQSRIVSIFNSFGVVLLESLCVSASSDYNYFSFIRAESIHKDLHNNLMNYDLSVQPGHGSGPSEVRVSVYVNSLVSVSDVQMAYTVDIQFILSWNDTRLNFVSCANATCRDKYDIRAMIHRIWKPDLFFLNSKRIYLHEEPQLNVRLLLTPNGNLVYTKRLTLDLECRMDISNYPLDTQYCPLIICSNTLTENELILLWDEYNADSVQLDPDVELTEFDLVPPVRTGCRKLVYSGTDISGNFSCVNATFVFKRQNSYHLVYSYMLTTFIVIVSWMSFWLDVHSAPARTSLGVTTLLTLSTTAASIRSRLPPVAYVTAIDVWLGFCSFFVFTASLEFPLCNYIARTKIHKKVQMPKWLFMRRRIAKDDSVTSLNSKSSVTGSTVNSNDEETGIEEAHLLDKSCRIVYPVLFLIFNLIYWPYYVNESSSNKPL